MTLMLAREKIYKMFAMYVYCIVTQFKDKDSIRKSCSHAVCLLAYHIRCVTYEMTQPLTDIGLFDRALEKDIVIAHW